MSYRLLRVHWVKYLAGEKVEDLYSYHPDETYVSDFIADFQKQESKSEFHYSPGCRGFVHVSGKLYADTKKSSKGIWAPLEQLESQLA